MGHVLSPVHIWKSIMIGSVFTRIGLLRSASLVIAYGFMIRVRSMRACDYFNVSFV